MQPNPVGRLHVVSRACARCGVAETRVRQLVTLGDLLGMPVPVDLADADPVLWGAAYCRSRDCAGSAARAYARQRLSSLKVHGRGVRS